MSLYRITWPSMIMRPRYKRLWPRNEEWIWNMVINHEIQHSLIQEICYISYLYIPDVCQQAAQLFNSLLCSPGWSDMYYEFTLHLEKWLGHLVVRIWLQLWVMLWWQFFSKCLYRSIECHGCYQITCFLDMPLLKPSYAGLKHKVRGQEISHIRCSLCLHLTAAFLL